MATKIWIGTDVDWATAGNWSPSGVPASTDNVYLENSSQSITSGLNQSAVTLASLNIDQSFTGSLGNAAAGAMTINTSILNIGYHNGPGTPAGSPSINLDLGTTDASVITVSNTGTSADASAAPVKLKAGSGGAITAFADGSGDVRVTSAAHGLADGDKVTISNSALYNGTNLTVSGKTTNTFDVPGSYSSDDSDASTFWALNNTLTVYKGKVEVGTDTADTTSAFALITSSYDTKVNTDTDIFIGTLAVSVPTLNILGGDVYLDTGAATANVKAGSLYTTGTGAITTLNVNGGTVTSNSTGTITTLNVFDGSGTVDFTKSNATRVVTTATLDPSGVLKFDDSVLTLTNNIKPYTAARNITYTAS